jgi:hypothetical protein
MQRRLGQLAAFVVGFTLGTRTLGRRRLRVVGGTTAGRRTGSRSATPARGVAKLRAVGALTVERTRDTVTGRFGRRRADGRGEAVVLELTTDLASAFTARRRRVG